MKKFTKIIQVFCLFILILNTETVFAQGPLETECFYQSEDNCITIGYQSVTEQLDDKNRLDVEVLLRVTCDNVKEISVNPKIGPPVIITQAEINGENQTVVFEVNANAFDNDNTLRFTIDYTDGKSTKVDIFYSEELNCGAIIPLPVELTDFKGKATESGISLEWETASELNNDHFNLERSADGNKFESIGTLQGRGTTSTPANYTLKDKAPLKGTNYYRLKQVDFDNSVNYSKTIAVKWNAGDEMKLAFLPNPCRNGDCRVTLSNVANTETLVQLKDMAGRVVYTKKIKGDSHLLEVPLDELKQFKGLFFLSATAGNQVKHQRILLE